MANKFATTNGNWSTAAIWSDGVVPTVGDDVWSNSFNITLDTDVSVKSLRSNISPLDLPFNPIPLMTSNTSPSGVANAGTNNSTAWNVFDQNDLTSWVSSTGLGTTAWVSYQLTSAVVVKRYFLLRPAVAGRPNGWLFQGSNDGSSWITLDTVVGDTGGTTYTSGILPNTTAYLHYRILVNTVTSGSSAQIFTFEITPDTTTTLGDKNGGSFIVNSNRTITCTDPSFGIFSGSATTVLIQATNSVININSNVVGGATSTINVIDIASTANTGNTVIIVGNLTSATTNVVPFRTVAPNTTLNITGNINALGTSNTINVAATSTLTNITITGDLITSGNNIAHVSTGNIVINGNILSPAAGYGIATTAGASITVNGNVFGSLASTGNGITQTLVTGAITVTGNVIGQNATAILTTMGSTIIVNGNVSNTSSTTALAISAAVNTTVRVSGNITNSSTRSAIFAGNIQLIGTTQFWNLKDALGSVDKFLYSPGTALGNPATGDVRLGVTYSGGALTGTLAVPTASSVAVGVPVDNTFGTGIFTIGDMGALLASYVV